MSHKYAFESFVSQLQARAEELGIPVKWEEKASWILMQSTVNEHKFYVPKSRVQMALCETTLPLALAPGGSPMPKDNGKIQAKFAPDLALIEQEVFPRLTATDDRLPANKPPVRRTASGGASRATVSAPGARFPGSTQSNPRTIDDVIAEELEASGGTEV